MGRKASPNPRSQRIQIPVTPEEKARIEATAAERSRDVATWIRDDLTLPEVSKAEKRRHRTPPA
jgi:hypothetical protein